MTYGMLATQNDPVKTTLNTNTTSRGQPPQQITPINITTHTRSVLGRTYWQLLTNPNITHLNATTTPIRYNRAKGLVGRSSEKIACATTIMAHPGIHTAYEEGLHGTEEDQHQTNQEQPAPNNTAKKPTPPTKGKEKTPSVERQIPDPLKQMRQKQAPEAKLLAAQQR